MIPDLYSASRATSIAWPIAVPPVGRGHRLERGAKRRGVVGLNRHQRVDAGREVVESDLDRKTRLLRRERIGRREHFLERLARDVELRPVVAAGLFAHRAGVVDHDRDRGAESFVACGDVLAGRPEWLSRLGGVGWFASGCGRRCRV